MGIVVLGAVFVDIKGYPQDVYIPGGRNAGRIEQVPGGVSRNVVEDIANVELRPTFVSLVDDTGLGEDVVRQLRTNSSIASLPDSEPLEALVGIPAHAWAAQRFLTGIVKVVHDNNVIACVQQFHTGVASNIACTASN